jgi:hypothetical protein
MALLSTTTARAQPLDTALLDDVLQRYSRRVADAAGVRVDYRELARSQDWRRLLANLATTNPDLLATRNEKLAFWINAYNILAIDLVVKNRPIESIRDIGNLLRPVWKLSAGRVGGRNVTLAGIEHETLRPMGEPRIHGAVVCASVSCPPLKRSAWLAESLGEQLDAAMRIWLADPATGLRVDAANETLYLSRVFDWFEEDFEPSGGVLAFIEPYLRPADRAWLARHPEPRIRHLSYDWNLNDLAGATTGD